MKTHTILILILLIFTTCTKSPSTNTPRYVILSPEIAEILSALNVSNRIVGITRECDYPPELQSIRTVGNFGQYNLESIIALNPSAVFTTALEQSEITTQLQRLNITTHQFYPRNIPELFDTIKSLGKIVEKETVADSLINYMQTNLEQFSYYKTEERKPTIYIEIYGNPIMSADDSSYLGQLLIYAGLDNIFPELIRDYARVNPEDVVSRNPDIILLTYPGITKEDIKNRKGWSNINAVINDRIYDINDINPDLILRAGPRNIMGIHKLAEFVP